MTDIFDLWSLLPQMKLREGNVFTLVCDSVHGRGVYPSMQWAGRCVSQHAMGMVCRPPLADTLWAGTPPPPAWPLK